MSRALLVIDVQREYFEGALPIRYPVGHLESILEVMDAAKRANIPTVVVRHHQPEADSPMFRLGSEMWQLHPEVEARPRDVLVDKQLPGSFTNTSLDEFLKERGVGTVCIAGYMTQICCDTTARQAFHRGYQVEFLRDEQRLAQQAHDRGLLVQRFVLELADERHRCAGVTAPWRGRRRWS